MSYQTAYTRSDYIDPVFLVITSVTGTLTWPVQDAFWGGTDTIVGTSYKFAWDGWYEQGIRFSPFTWGDVNGDSYVYIDTSDSFTNTDFANLVQIVFGIPGWLACGAPLTTTAVFTHDVQTAGWSDGGRGGQATDTASGACTDLVRETVEQDFGPPPS